MVVFLFFVFFFQAEDGIRDGRVTGVQTCALPIYLNRAAVRRTARESGEKIRVSAIRAERVHKKSRYPPRNQHHRLRVPRSEERRVGKSVDLGGRRIIKKKKYK